MYKYLEKLTKDKLIRVALILLGVVTILRFHTLFNSYYDRDSLGSILSATKYLRDGIDMEHYYGLAYKLVYRINISIFGPFSYVGIHISAILIIFLTSLAIYFTVLTVSNKKAAFFSAVLYAISSSCNTKDYLALCAEFVFNFYISLAFLFFVLAEFSPNNKIPLKRAFFWLLSLTAYTITANIKLHAVFFGGVYILYFFFSNILTTPKKKLIIAGSFVILGGTALVLLKDFAYILNFGPIKEIVIYLQSSSYSFKKTTMKIILAVSGHLSIQFTVFVSAFIYIKYLKVENQELKKALLFFFFISLIVPFLTLRMYFHYFIQLLLPASIIAGIAMDKVFKGEIFDKNKIKIYSKAINILTIATVIFFVGSYTLALSVKLINPKYKTTINMFYPNKKLLPAIEWVKENTKKEDNIFVWGDALEIYYFSKRYPAGYSIWLKPFAKNYLLSLQNKNVVSSNFSISQMQHLINTLGQGKANYFVDTQPSGYSGFGDFDLHKFQPLYNYITEHFNKVANVGGFVIYKRKILF
jgi:hypothetical protein